MSPIKGVSEVVRLPRLGKIRLGLRKETDDGMVYPSPTDYFVCPEEVKKVYGDKPKELRVMFPTEDESQWASQFLKCYSATRGLICRGDGETAIARVDIGTGEIATRDAVDTELREISCSPDICPYYERSRCRRVMNLQFLLPDCPGFGVYQLDTSSFNSIRNVNSTIAFIRGICGRISMIPLLLKLVEQEVQPDGRRKTVRVLSLSAPYSLIEVQRYAQIPVGQSLLLPPPDTEAPDDLFPEEVLKQDIESSDIPAVDEELLRVWEKVKKKICELDVQDAQISIWFLKNYHLNVVRGDFESALPPSKLTLDRLSNFYKAVERYQARR
ncbi:MAG: hypothetical protein PHI12_14155 [Dehalococcoidales bacterium]|nr:hypothetical protein [Dehalococcoidales bacterium]MDD5511930.1 hypothetical protein [Dehalococcoidales bacterium]